jgi:autotransporter-associated beta strand protein
VRLGTSPTVTVTPGAAPELRVTGPISETGGSQSITKAGTGTMLLSSHNTYSGPTTVSAGTVLADGNQTGAFSVGQNGTLAGSGTVGATTVAGVLAPSAPGLHTGALSFGPTGRLAVTLTSVAPATIPAVVATGTVAIDPSAALDLDVAPATALPHGSSPVLIANDGVDAIGGQFMGIPPNSALSTPAGVPLAVSYAGGDGNDLALTAGNVPPQVGSSSATPNPVAAGQQVALSVTESDANQDPLTTTWNFGDGATGSGQATTHAYTAPGTYTTVATVSDGLAQVRSTIVIRVIGPGPTVPTGGGSGGTTTVTSSGYGASFGLTVAGACVRKGTPFGVTLTISRRTKRKAKGNVLVKVTKVVFAIDGKSVKTVRSPPFRARLTVPRAAPSGGRITLRATASLKMRSGARRAKALTVAVAVC